jgi:hypothetical protein
MTADQARQMTAEARAVEVTANDCITFVDSKVAEAAHKGYSSVEVVDIPASVREVVIDSLRSNGFSIEADDWGDGNPIKLRVSWK